MKRYGNEKTMLTLEPKAQAVYNSTDPLIICDLEDGTYSISGVIEKTGLTASEVNEALVEFSKDLFIVAVQDLEADQQYDDLVIDYNETCLEDNDWYTPAHDSDHSYMLIQDSEGNIQIV